MGFDRYSDAPHTWRIFRAGQNKFLVQASYNLCYPTATFGYRIHEKCQGKERGQSPGEEGMFDMLIIWYFISYAGRQF